MVDKRRSASAFHLRPEFDGFLFASIGKDANGMPLSVLSALARLDVDPWQEAADLARLPGEAAIRRLASLIAGQAGEAAMCRDPGSTATDLVKLLPRQVNYNIPLGESSRRVGLTTNTRNTVTYAILMAFMLGFQYLVVSHLAAVQAADTHVSSSSIVSSQEHSLNSRR